MAKTGNIVLEKGPVKLEAELARASPEIFAVCGLPLSRGDIKLVIDGKKPKLYRVLLILSQNKCFVK